MLTWLHLQLQRLRKLGFIKQRNRTIPDAMWQRTLRDYPFLTVDPANKSVTPWRWQLPLRHVYRCCT
jgi:hypothetical protein